MLNDMEPFKEHQLRIKVEVGNIKMEVVTIDHAIKIANSRNIKNMFHYFDPPYPMADQGHYKGYGWDQYEKLLEFCANDCKGKFMLSNYNSEMLDRFVNECGWYKLEITNRITGKKVNGSKSQGHLPARTEVLVYNYPNTCGTLKLFN